MFAKNRSLKAPKNNGLKLNQENMPKHVAIIMDGNGRWAKAKGLIRTLGHRQGTVTLKKIIELVDELHIKYLTVYAFSTENWQRSETEVDALMELLIEFLQKELAYLMEKKVKINFIGELEMLPNHVLKVTDHVANETKNNNGLVVNVALSYGSRKEIVNAVKKIAAKVKSDELKIADIDEASFENELYTAGQPSPDLVIRTSGELRISNFLLWQIAYSELYFTDINWPDFNEAEFKKAVLDYQNRKRRYGK